MRISALFLATVFAFAISSCGSGESKSNNTVADAIEEEISGEDIEMEFEEDEPDVVFMLPSPLQIGSIFKNAGLTYQEGIVVDPNSAKSLTTSVDKSLALGILFADMTYCILNDQTQTGQEFLKAIKEVSDEVGMGNVFEGTNLVARFENNLGNQDSVLNLLIDIQDRIDLHLHENGQDEMEVIIFAGGWVEGMHLGANSPREGKNSIPARIAEQMTILENVVGLLSESEQTSPKLDELRSQMNDLLAMYELSEKEDKRGEESYNITQAHIDKIAKSVETMRNLITNS